MESANDSSFSNCFFGYLLVKILIIEIDGIETILLILKSLSKFVEQDTPVDDYNNDIRLEAEEVLENFLGINRGFSCDDLKLLYEELLKDILEDIVKRTNLFELIRNLHLKSAQWCEDGQNTLLLKLGDENAN